MSSDLKTIYQKKVEQEQQQPTRTRTIIDPTHSGYYTLEFENGRPISIYIILIRVDNKNLIIVIEANNDEESESNINLYGFIFESDFSFEFNDLLSRLYNISKYKNQANIPIHHSYVYLVTKTEILTSELDQLLNNPNNNLKIREIDSGYIINGLDFLVFQPNLLADFQHSSIIVHVYNKPFKLSLDYEAGNSDGVITYFSFKTLLPEQEEQQPDSLKYELSDDTALERILEDAEQNIATAEEASSALEDAHAAFIAATEEA